MELSEGMIGVLGTFAGTLLGWGLTSMTDRLNTSKRKKAVFLEIEDTLAKIDTAIGYLYKVANNLCIDNPSPFVTYPAPVKLYITEEYFKQVYVNFHPSERINISNLIEYAHTLNDAIAQLELAAETNVSRRQYFDIATIAYSAAQNMKLYAAQLLESRKSIVDTSNEKFQQLHNEISKSRREMLLELVKRFNLQPPT